jgi:ornithine cyclodeaminase/alanine dehydrogenase-like protein (mu-crystallin family)
MGIMIGEINEKTLGYTSLMALRTAATSGVGFRHMPRADATTVGLFGTKGQALNHLLALKVERPIKQVKVYSRSAENRRRFAEAASKILALEIAPVDTPKDVIKGVDVVVSATNSSVPVFEGEWLEEGQHVTSIIGSNSALVKGGWLKSPRRENDDETIVRADRLIVNYIESVIQDEQADIHEPIEKGLITWEDVHELGEMLNGKYAPRESDAEITLHKNQIGLGIADLAVAKLAFDRACELQRGSTIELPTPGFDRRFLG